MFTAVVVPSCSGLSVGSHRQPNTSSTSRTSRTHRRNTGIIKMIKGSSYKCASADSPAEATLICYQDGCMVYPFLCGRASCACMALHGNHQCKPLDGFLKTLAVSSNHPNELTREEKEIIGFIDRLIGDLSSLKQRHKAHIEKHCIDTRKFTELLQRLLQGEQLYSK